MWLKDNFFISNSRLYNLFTGFLQKVHYILLVSVSMCFILQFLSYLFYFNTSEVKFA